MPVPRRPIPGTTTSSHSRPGYLTFKEARSQLPISFNKLKRLLDEGTIPSIRNGKARLISIAELVAYEEKLLEESRAGKK